MKSNVSFDAISDELLQEGRDVCLRMSELAGCVLGWRHEIKHAQKALFDLQINLMKAEEEAHAYYKDNFLTPGDKK